MITIIYRILILIVLLLAVINIFTEDKLTKQIDKALVIIPLILRFLMIK